MRKSGLGLAGIVLGAGLLFNEAALSESSPLKVIYNVIPDRNSIDYYKKILDNIAIMGTGIILTIGIYRSLKDKD